MTNGAEVRRRDVKETAPLGEQRERIKKIERCHNKGVSQLVE